MLATVGLSTKATTVDGESERFTLKGRRRAALGESAQSPHSVSRLSGDKTPPHRFLERSS